MARFNRDQELKEKIVYGNQAFSQKETVKESKAAEGGASERLSEQAIPSCTISDEALDVLKQSADQGAVMMELFRSPEVLWENRQARFRRTLSRDY